MSAVMWLCLVLQGFSGGGAEVQLRPRWFCFVLFCLRVGGELTLVHKPETLFLSFFGADQSLIVLRAWWWRERMGKGEKGRWVRVLDEVSLNHKDRKGKRPYYRNEVCTVTLRTKVPVCRWKPLLASVGLVTSQNVQWETVEKTSFHYSRANTLKYHQELTDFLHLLPGLFLPCWLLPPPIFSLTFTHFCLVLSRCEKKQINWEISPFNLM